MDSFSATAKANSVLEGPSYSPLPSSSLAIDTTTSTVLSVTKERSFSDLMEYPISILLICALLLIISICALLLCRWYIRHEQKLAEKRLYIDKLRMAPWSTMNSSHSRSIMEANIIYTDQDIAQGQTYGYIDKYEMPYERLRLGRVIGQGAFGLVYMGMAEGINGVVGPTTVAIKQLKANADESER
uniref:Protein kinase domain-containing protein n=1 Tax=Plectus sambesii TaxID=2011161 RepID=A0A914VA65_9BILA